MTIKVPEGYKIISYKDTIIALPRWEPAFRPKIWNAKTKRWNYIKYLDDKVRVAMELEYSSVYWLGDSGLMSMTSSGDITKWS